MAIQDCINEIKAGLETDISDDELLDLMTDLQRRAEIRRVNNKLETQEEALLNAADELRKDIEIAKTVEKRNRLINIKVRSRMMRLATEMYEQTGDPSLALQAETVGTIQNLKNNRQSVDARSTAILSEYMGGFTFDLKREGVLADFNSKRLEREIAIELAELSKPDGRPGLSGDDAALKVAKVIDKYRKAALARENRAGAWVKPLPGYITRQTHDMARMRRAGFEAWRDYIEPRLDARTFEGVDDPEKFLRSSYNALITGVHMKSADEQIDTMFAFKGPGNLAKRASSHRKLHFKDADAWFEYNKEFGTGRLSDAIIKDFERSARQTAIMERFGTNPRAMFDSIREALINKYRDDYNVVKRLQRDSLTWNIEWVDGTARIPGNVSFSLVSSIIRSINTVRMLGGAFLSSLADPALHTTEVYKQGVPLLNAWGQTFQNYATGLKPGRERREYADLIGAAIDGALGDMHARFASGDTVPGFVSKMSQLYFKLNLLGPWTEASKRGIALMMSRRLAQMKDMSFDKVPKMERDMLIRYGLEGEKWEALRGAIRKTEDGTEYMMPDAVRDLPDSVIDRVAAEDLAGLKADAAKNRVRQKARDDLETNLRAFYIDRASFATSEPTAREQSFILAGTKPGTVTGEAVRFIVQFKSFPFTIMMKPLGEMFYANGYAKSTVQALRTGKADKIGLANLIIGSTVLGYLSLNAKEIAKGREPRPADDYRTWLAASIQGGGLGLYGDFLFGEFTRFGQTPIESIAGPTISTASDLVTLFSEARQGNDVAASVFYQTISMIPFQNLFYARTTLDYLLLYNIQEQLNPGYLRRMERRIKKENDQEFIIPPSSVVR